MFKVEFRKDCKVCGGDITAKRFRSYCSDTCRNKFNNKKYAQQHVEWNRIRRDQNASKPDDKKVQCLICGKYYVQVGSHIVQVHGVTAREYREAYDLEVKKGTVPAWYRELKGDQALENKTFQNLLKAGAKYRFKKGDPRAGKYKRSPITVNRLRNLKQNYKNKKDLKS